MRCEIASPTPPSNTIDIKKITALRAVLPMPGAALACHPT
jgi:hypothetical protein